MTDNNNEMTDLEALRYAPMSLVLSGLLSLGLTLMIDASWRFGAGLTITLGMTFWFLTVADQNKRRKRQPAPPIKLDKERGE